MPDVSPMISENHFVDTLENTITNDSVQIAIPSKLWIFFGHVASLTGLLNYIIRTSTELNGTTGQSNYGLIMLRMSHMHLLTIGCYVSSMCVIRSTTELITKLPDDRLITDGREYGSPTGT